MSDDDRRVYDLVARRFLAVFHPEAVFENTRLETDGRRARLPHARPGAARAGLARRLRRGARRTAPAPTTTRAPSSSCPKLEQGEAVQHARGRVAAEKETKPPRRYSDASLLGAMETAGKLVDDDELREAMKDSGIGTPATRAAIIERLIDVGYVERDGRALVAPRRALNVIRLLGEHPLTSPAMTGDWEHRLGRIEHGEDSRERFMDDIAEFARGTVARARRQAQGRAASRAPTSARARSAGATSSRTARATRAGRARIRAAAS